MAVPVLVINIADGEGGGVQAKACPKGALQGVVEGGGVLRVPAPYGIQHHRCIRGCACEGARLVLQAWRAVLSLGAGVAGAQNGAGHNTAR